MVLKDTSVTSLVYFSVLKDRRNWFGQAPQKATVLKVAVVVTGSCFATSWPMKVFRGDTNWRVGLF